MKRSCLIILFLCCAFLMKAQSGGGVNVSPEGNNVYVPRNWNFDLKLPEPSFNTYAVTFWNMRIDSVLRNFSPDVPVISLEDHPMNRRILSGAYLPFFNVYTSMLRRVSSMAFDFRESSIVPVNENAFFIITGEQQTWPGAGGVMTVSPGMIWKSSDLTVYGGGFAGRFYTPFNSSPELMGGVNLSLHYELTDWMALRGWGQFTYYGEERKNPHLQMNPFFNHTNVGGAMEFKVNENFGMGFGVNYEYNHLRRKLEPQYLLYPVFNTGNVQIRMGR